MMLSKFLRFIPSLFAAASGFANPPQVAIIGGGFAGLTTAYRLQQHGIEAHVYEARGRVGGRVLSAKIGDDIVELGGQNIGDGGEAKNLLGLIKEFDLETVSYRVKLGFEYFDDKNLISQFSLNPKFQDPDQLKWQLEQAAQKAANMRDVLSSIIPKDNPLHQALATRLNAYEGATVDRLSPIYHETLYHMLLGGLCSAHQSSGTEETHVDILSLKQGNSLLAEKLAQNLGDKVHLDHPLIAISKTSNQYTLTFQNGKEVQADILVLAIPCSVYTDITFGEGVIPQEKLASIQKVEYGTNAKILIPFTQEPNSRKSLIDQRAGCFFANPHILTLYYAGEASKFTQDTLSAAYQKERPMLEQGFKDTYPSSTTLTYAQDILWGTYNGPIGYSWPSDPYVKGSYSYIAAGQETLLTTLQQDTQETYKALFAPINKTLYFAGEHTSILMDVPGTMEAACESGERTARAIIGTL